MTLEEFQEIMNKDPKDISVEERKALEEFILQMKACSFKG
ncbi:hypothetical protein SAMN02745174_01593 [Cetobacterium ceti]|uniref:Uncharacterized protein n=1 Tax=Cetobacterium ceti TaxID=180163 RepID=A0A1T4NMK1_9FUSO|nr:hypothetical protein SAMN02745174_01593 [Cetobacterium ceti]